MTLKAWMLQQHMLQICYQLSQLIVCFLIAILYSYSSNEIITRKDTFIYLLVKYCRGWIIKQNVNHPLVLQLKLGLEVSVWELQLLFIQLHAVPMADMAMGAFIPST